jgi:uncharacterized heparinase superfamily protein
VDISTVNANWHLRRLLAMSPAEIAARIPRSARHRLDDLSWRTMRPLWRSAWEPEVERVSRRPPPAPQGFLTPERARGLLCRDPQGAARTVEAAEAAAAGRFRFFGYPEVELPRPIDFSRDPFSGRLWPPRHSKTIDHRRGEFGDPKWAWELNRCQHLPLLVEAWLLTGDEQFAERAVSDFTDWVSQQPPGRGIAWANSLEVGLRAISFACTYDALRASKAMPPASAEKALLSLWQHGKWITRDPSTHSSANNHRIGELTGLATVALLVPELRAAERWERLAVDGLASEAERQILRDGVGAEQAFAYQLFVLELLLLTVAVLECRGLAVPEEISAALERSADAIAVEVGDDEPEPTYGDADDGRAIRLDADDSCGARSVAASLSAYLGHSGARRVARALDPAAWWLFGAAGADRFDATMAAGPSESAWLSDGGIVVLRDSSRRAIVDVGPLGYLSLAAHGHADALQMTLADRGEDLVVDPGVGSYYARPDLRDAFRGTAFHPTVVVDGVDQSEAGGAFLWRSHAQTTLLHLDLEQGVVVAAHDGYRRLPDPVDHTRAIAALPDGGVVVCDQLSAAAEHHFAQRWPLHPALEAAQAGDQVLRVTRAGQPRLLIALAASVPARLELVRGREDPPAGWWSPRLEEKVPAWLGSWEAHHRGRVHLAAFLFPMRAEAWPTAELSLSSEGSSAVIEVARPGELVQVVVDFERAAIEVVARSEPELLPVGAGR